MDGYENLANAIIELAAKDYKSDIAYLQKNKGKDDYAVRQRKADKKEIERFFRSGWFEILTDLDGEYLLNRMQEMMGWEDEE